MNKLISICKRFTLFLLLFASLAVTYTVMNLRASLPTVDGAITLATLQKPVQITLDEHGDPTINATTNLDAFRALGFLTARERLFQMDLLRRKSAGRLSEVFGNAALDIDIQQRHLQLEHAAKAIVTHLPESQFKALEAYADGINAAINQMQILPFEFLVLRYTPADWQVEDSLLVALNMFQLLSSEQESERMLSVMEQALPEQITTFLTTDTDMYDSILTGGNDAWHPKQQIPVEAIVSILDSKPGKTDYNPSLQAKQTEHDVPINIDDDDLAPGSNGWVVAGSKTSDGRAILANDMHLPLRVPNIWYRATIKYPGWMVSGVTLPGLPLIIAGSNNHVAWGYTNAYVDLVDLVKIEVNPGNPDQYKTTDGWENFKHVTEHIHIKNQDSITIDVRNTRWGPVTTRSLLGKPVALKWTALDPAAVDLGLINMHEAKTLEQAISVMNHAGGPPQNAMLADNTGRIAWTLMGKIPKRKGFDGSLSRSWTTNDIGWDGYINASQLPRVIDPPSGFLVTANNRTTGKHYPFKLGHDYQIGFRAWRISQRLQSMQSVTEQDMLKLQLDTSTEFYRYYQSLALSVLTPAVITEKPSRQELRDYIASWDGKAEINSTGLPVLFEFRKALINTVLPAYYQPCLTVQSDFRFAWSKKEVPVRQLLDARIPATMPHQKDYVNWDALILDVLEKTARELAASHQVERLADLTWGKTNMSNIKHPFSHRIPALSTLLDMPEKALAGCPYCIRVVYGLFGASERMVVSPGHLQQAILHMPTGQSGHPMSDYYGDQYPYWEQGKILPLISTVVDKKFELIPSIR